MKDINTLEIEKAQAAAEQANYLKWREYNPELAAAQDRKRTARYKKYHARVNELISELHRKYPESKNAVN